MVILETPRLILREFIAVDLDEVFDLLYADRQVNDTWSGATGTRQEIIDRFSRNHIQRQDKFGFKAVMVKESNHLTGLMGFQPHDQAGGKDIAYLQTREHPDRTVNFDPDCLEVELTYALGRAYWKKGYATEMGQAIISYGFQSLGIGRIIQSVLGHNQNSINLMQRLGFRLEHGYSGNVVGILDKKDFFFEPFWQIP
jgi:[ribosomal protein S5]-alanine N-acetyltransferase